MRRERGGIEAIGQQEFRHSRTHGTDSGESGWMPLLDATRYVAADLQPA